MITELVGLSADAYLAKFARIGGIVEERIVADGVLSPSVQLRITPCASCSYFRRTISFSVGPLGRVTSERGFRPIMHTRQRSRKRRWKLASWSPTKVSSGALPSTS